MAHPITPSRPLSRRHVSMAAAAALAGLALPARAQWAPSRPIQIVVGFAPGGGTDATGRLIAAAAQDLFPVPIVVMNKPGASGTLAAEQVANASGDGYTLLVAGGSESTSIHHYQKTSYKLSQFRGVIRVNRERMMIVSKAGDAGAIDSIAKLVDYARKNPGRAAYGSSGEGSILQSAFVVFCKEAKIDMLHVPYKGGAPALIDLLAGQITVTILTPADAKAQRDAGKVHVLASTSDRDPQLPGVPSLGELGYAVNLENQKGLVAPASTPDDIVRYLHDRFKTAMERPRWKQLADAARIESAYLDGAGFTAAMSAMSDEIGKAVSTQDARRIIAR